MLKVLTMQFVCAGGIHISLNYYSFFIIIFMELTAQKGKGDRGKRTSDRVRTRDLCSITEFQPREPQRPVEILRPHRSYVPLFSDTQDLRLEASTVCYVMVAGSAVPSTLHDFASLRWKAASISLYSLHIQRDRGGSLKLRDKCRSRVRARLLVLFPLSPFPF